MADVNNLKIDGITPQIMFAGYHTPLDNEGVFFTSIVPKSNEWADITTFVSGQWQINDGWEVEILSQRKIAIKKFKIDTWGLRFIWDPNWTDAQRNVYRQMRVRVSGLDYVHNNVVCHTSGSDTPDGFTEAYAGTGGYNVYWYPGQFTSGRYFKGLGIQGGIGYVASLNERDDSLCMGKHPWDIGNTTNVSDTIVAGKWCDGGYKATTIGLYGGVQNAASWHDETGEAYRVYDISDTPIILDLDVPNTSDVPIDPSSVECWDVKLGEETVYHKDRTRENCWAKYGMLFPEGYNLIPSNLTKSSDNLEWIASNRLRLTKASTTAITLKKESTTAVNTSSTTPSYLGFKVHIWNKPDNVTITFERTFTNMTEDHNVLIALENGTTEIPAFSEKMYLSSVSTTSYLTEFLLTITADEDVDCGIIIELEPIFTEDCYKKMIPNTAWNMLSKLNIPDVVDKTSIDMLRTTWNMKPENTEIWDSIKEWFANNEITDTLLQHPLFQNSNVDEITLNLSSLIYENPSRYMYANRPFSGSTVKKINLVSKNGCSFSVGNGLFFGANNLEEITFTPKEDDVQWLVGATDFSGMFSKVYNLKTYPSNLINWGSVRSNVWNFTRYATSMQYFMDYGSLETIPIYNDGDRFADENTIIFGTFADQVFNCGSTLKYIGPVLDLVLVQPSNAKNIFRCEGLTDVRIKNLNHGDWNLDGVTRNQYNGYLASLDADSMTYLFENLVDLNTSNPEAHEESIKNSFRLWSSDYKYTYQNNEYEYRCELRSLLARKRVAEGGDAPYIAYTNAVLEDIKINVVGLKTGDSLEWGDTIITTNGIHTISNDGSGIKGFKLYGDPSNTTDIVYIHLVNGLDYGNPVQSTANLYCPGNWMSMDNAKVAEVFGVKNGGSASGNVLSVSQRMGTYADANTFAYKQNFTCKNLKIKVTGLQEGDTLWLGNLTSGYRCGGVSVDGTYSIEEISSSAINLSDEWTYAEGTKVSVWVAFALINADTSITDTVTIEFISEGTNETPCYVMGIPYRGELITSDMISAANTKGWTIYVGGYNKLWMTSGYETANKTIELVTKWYGVNIVPEWSIDSDVATIEGNVLTFNTSGSVTVTATYEGVSVSETFSYIPDSIEYLQANGGQYVDTLYNPGPTTEFDLDVYLSNEGTTSGAIWSTVDDTYTFSCNQGGDNATNIYYWSPLPYANDNSRIRMLSGVTLNQRINLGMKLVDGVRYGYYGDRLSPALLDLEATLSGTIILFASTSGAKWSTDARIYGITIKEDGEIVRHFVPAINNAGIPCLYEEIEGKYYLSLGAPFIAS